MKRITTATTRIIIGLVVAATTWMGITGAAVAQGEDEEYEPWDVAPYRFVEVTQPHGFFHIAPMVGATGVYGDLTSQGQTAEVEFSPVDALDSFDLDIGVTAEAGYGRTSVLADMRYLHVITDEFDLDNDNGEELDLRHFVSHLALHRVFFPHRDFHIGPVGGARIVYADVRLDDDGDNFGNRATETWVEPVVGIRGRLELGDVFFVPYHVDVGGLGLGSRMSWQAYGALGFHVNDLDLELGYRHMFLELDASRDITYDLNVTGPTLQATFRFEGVRGVR